MKKYFYNSYLLPQIISIFLGALSQPLVAVAFISFGEALRKEDLNFSSFYFPLSVIVFAMLASSVSHIIKSWISNVEMNLLRTDIFSSILRKSLSDFHKIDSGEYYNFVLRKVDVWQASYYNQFWNIIQFGLESIIIVLLIFYTNRIAGVVCLIMLCPLILNNIIFPHAIEKKYTIFLENDSKMVTKIKEFLGGFNAIKYSQAEDYYLSKMKVFFTKANTSNQYVSFLNNMSGTIANICVVLSQAGGIVIGIVLLADENISIGLFIALLQLTTYINEPVIKLINSMVMFLATKGINKDLEKMCIGNKKGSRENFFPMPIGEVQLSNISFQYEGKLNKIFEDFSYTFKRGNKYLIIGESGSGKSTLIKIILGQVQQSAGTVKFNGDILDESEIYSTVGIVSQDTFIFDDSIKNNIDIADLHTDEEVEEVIKKVKLQKFVESKKEGIHSVINEEVMQVSGGERAKIGLARVILENKEVVIFDEILSSIDNQNAYEIEKLILSLDNKIVIHIAHKYIKQLSSGYNDIIEIEFLRRGSQI